MGSQRTALLLLGVLLIAASTSNAANIDHHMYWGMAAKDQIWAEFDSSFASDLDFSWPCYDSMRLLRNKFYLIGLTLPDAMLNGRQSVSRGIISGLWSARAKIDSVAGFWGYVLNLIPMYVDSMTNVEVQTPITFNGPDSNDNSHNFQKLWEMARYARDQNWSGYEKSLIYGALAHCMQDGYVEMVSIPTRFGQGFALDAPEARDHSVLNYGGTYDELLAGTHIPSWYFTYHLFGCILVSGQTVHCKHEAMQLYSRCGVDGQNYQDWQDLDFLPVERFVDAAVVTGYATASLTQERLESYLHGWGMFEFMLYGYGMDGGLPSNVGGIVAHPTWSPQRITEFWYDIRTADWQFGKFVTVLSDAIQFFRSFPVVGQEMDSLLNALPHRKLPRTPDVIRMLIRRAVNAAGLNPRVNRLREPLVLHQSDRLAGEIGQPLPLARRLNPAVKHPEHNPVLALLNCILLVEERIHAQRQRLDQRGNPAARRDSVPLHNPLRFHDREALPGLGIGLDCRVEAVGPFDRLEPQPVVRQPVPRRVLNQPDQVIATQPGELWESLAHIC
jgi:hypothetical protein